MSNVTSVVPIIKVRDITSAVKFYSAQLGFEVLSVFSRDAPNPGYATVALGAHHVHLSSFPGDGVDGAARVYFHVSDINRLRSELQLAGLREVPEPMDQDWGQHEIYITDPDGNQLRFGAPRRAA